MFCHRVPLRVIKAVLAGLILTAIAIHCPGQLYEFRHLAGPAPDSTASGSNDGTGSDARFNLPCAVAVDGAGNTYVGDTFNNTVRKISPDGVVTTLAGSPGQYGSVDGVGAAARFGSIMGITVDANSNVYLTQTEFPAIRKISPDGTVTTWAGSPNEIGRRDSIGGDARFISPEGITVDSAGNLYVADRAARNIRKISPQQVVTTVDSSAPMISVPPADPFGYPIQIAVDPAGNIYVADGLLQKRDVNGVVTAQSFFPRPVTGITFDQNGTMFVTDYRDHVVAKLGADGTLTDIAGSFIGRGNADGVGSGARFDGPRNIAVDRAGNLLVADSHNNAIRIGKLYVPPPVVKPPRLVNLAARAYCSTGTKVTIGGFVIAGNVSKQVLVRAVGPSLESQGLKSTDILLDPMVQVYQGGTVIASNDDAGSNSNLAQLNVAVTQFGATPFLSTDSKSSALLLQLPPGVYSFVASGKNASSGIVLLEVYDADADDKKSALVNIATRAYATTGDGVTIGGFVISGSKAKQVLLRAVGPTLTTSGIAQSDVLLDPMIELHQGASVIAANDDWSDNTNAGLITTTAARIGASPLAATDTRSSALLLTLEPGVYSFVVSGKSGTSGVVLVEAYDAD